MSEWYRNKEWSAETSTMFHQKLKRARSQRDQYIVLQALALTETEPQAALDLVELYFATRSDDFDDARAQLARTRALVSLGRLEDAADSYRETIDTERSAPFLSVAAGSQYAAFLVIHGVTSRFDEVEAGLGPEPDLFLMPSEGFTFHVCRAVVAAHKGEADRAEYHRCAAEFEAVRTVSAVPDHPALGLVGPPDAALRKVLDRTFPRVNQA